MICWNGCSDVGRKRPTVAPLFFLLECDQAFSLSPWHCFLVSVVIKSYMCLSHSWTLVLVEDLNGRVCGRCCVSLSCFWRYSWLCGSLFLTCGFASQAFNPASDNSAAVMGIYQFRQCCKHNTWEDTHVFTGASCTLGGIQASHIQALKLTGQNLWLKKETL